MLKNTVVQCVLLVISTILAGIFETQDIHAMAVAFVMIAIFILNILLIRYLDSGGK
jgi:hypothetical protein